MSKTASFFDTVDQIIRYGKDKKILHLFTDSEAFAGTTIRIDGKAVLNFGSCSYLGFEFDERLKEGAKKAIDDFGTQFSESRAYVSLGLYRELGALLTKIFNAPCVVTPTTTLGHIANIPVMVEDHHAIILDQQVHNSVQTAVQIVKARGVRTELIRHNRMDLLEEKIIELRDKHEKVWYMADGIYSMFGDACPAQEIYALMDKYPCLHLYVDDAHGMSIHGKHGRGYMLKDREIHPKMVMATSLNKAFASGGGVLVYGDAALADKVNNTGGPLLSSGPMQPGGLGAALACAKIHLSEEITILQDQLRENLLFTELLLKKYDLPVISKAGAAVFFIGVSLPKLGHKLVRLMLDEGFYVNLGIFPTVPMRQTGVRFTITRLHSFAEIESMVRTLARHFPKAMEEEGISLKEIYRSFKIPMPEEAIAKVAADSAIMQSLTMGLSHHTSITEIEKHVWNGMFENRGSFDWEGLRDLEESFTGNERQEENWKFDYVIVKDVTEKIISACFFTTALWKDDMLAPALVSEKIETKREKDPYYLTGKVICCGSLITEGEHLFIDKTHRDWKDGVRLIIEKMYALQELHKATHLVMRDFHGIDADIDNLMTDNGFFRFEMPNSHSITVDWINEKSYYAMLSKRSQMQLRSSVLRNEDLFETKVFNAGEGSAFTDQWYELYLNVQRKNKALNTFALPRKLFSVLAESDRWEVVTLYLKDAAGMPVCCSMVYCYKTPTAYIPMIIGIDYQFNKHYNVYRQTLYRVLMRARELRRQQVFLGFSADIEKKKLGALTRKTHAYMHSSDTFNMEILAALTSDQAAE